MNYHCGGEDGNPLINNGIEGGIDRITRSGAGVLMGDMYLFKENTYWG